MPMHAHVAHVVVVMRSACATPSLLVLPSWCEASCFVRECAHSRERKPM